MKLTSASILCAVLFGLMTNHVEGERFEPPSFAAPVIPLNEYRSRSWEGGERHRWGEGEDAVVFLWTRVFDGIPEGVEYKLRIEVFDPYNPDDPDAYHLTELHLMRLERHIERCLAAKKAESLSGAEFRFRHTNREGTDYDFCYFDAKSGAFDTVLDRKKPGGNQFFPDMVEVMKTPELLLDFVRAAIAKLAGFKSIPRTFE